MKKSFLENLLDKIKFVFLTLFHFCLLIVPGYRRPAIVRRIEDTEYFQDEVDLVCLRRRLIPAIPSSNALKVIKSVQKLREEQQVQKREAKAGSSRIVTKTETMLKIKQNLEKCKEKVRERDEKRIMKAQQKDIVKAMNKSKSSKIEIHTELLIDKAEEQKKTHAVLQDCPKVATYRIDRSHEHQRDRKHRESKSQELLISVRMSKAERMRTAMKNYSDLLKKRQNEKRRSSTEARSGSRDASLSGMQMKVESKQEPIKERTTKLLHRSRETVKNANKYTASGLAEKSQLQQCSELKRKELAKAAPAACESPKSELVETHREKHTSWTCRHITKAASANDIAYSARLAKYHERKELLKNFTITMKLDIKKKYESIAEYPKEVKPKLSGLRINEEVVQKVSKTYCMKERLEKTKQNSPEKLKSLLKKNSKWNLKDKRQKTPATINVGDMKDKAKINAKSERTEQQLDRNGTTLVRQSPTTMREMELADKQQLRREGTIVLKKTCNEEEESKEDVSVMPKYETQPIEENFNEDEVDLSQEKCPNTAQLQNDDDASEPGVNSEDLEILEKLRIMRQLDKVEKDLLENEIFLDFLTSDEEDMKMKIDEEQQEENQPQVEEEAGDSSEVNQMKTNAVEKSVKSELRKRQQLEDLNEEMIGDVTSAKRQKKSQNLSAAESEVTFVELTKEEVLDDAPIIKDYTEDVEKEKEIPTDSTMKESPQANEMECKKVHEEHQANESVRLKVKIGFENSEFSKIPAQLQEAANQIISDATTASNEKQEIAQTSKPIHDVIKLGNEDRETIKDITKEILELILKSRLPNKSPFDNVQMEQLEEKVVDKLQETMYEKMQGKCVNTAQETAEKDIVTDDHCSAPKANENAWNSKYTKSSLQIQLRDIINETNEIDESKIVSAVVVLMSNIIERVCQQQQEEKE